MTDTDPFNGQRVSNSPSPGSIDKIPLHGRISNSPPMAVLPLNSSSKLDQEPNPFEKSFSGAAVVEKKDKEPKPTLPPVASITSPAISLIGSGVLPKEVTNQFGWESLRTGPLSPSMLQGPTKPDEFGDYRSIMHQKSVGSNLGIQTSNSQPTYSRSYDPSNSQTHQISSPTSSTSPPTSSSHQQGHRNYGIPEYARPVKVKQEYPDERDYQHIHRETQKHHQLPEKTPSRKSMRRKTAQQEEPKESLSQKRQRTKEKTPEDEEKRKNFLERNRIAALKCRQRKKQWLSNLQGKVEYLSGDNDRLQMEAEALREEIVNLKTLLLAHKDCPIAQANGFHPSIVQKPMQSMMQPMMQPMMRSTNQGASMYSSPANNNNNNNNTSSSSYQGMNNSSTSPTRPNTSSPLSSVSVPHPSGSAAAAEAAPISRSSPFYHNNNINVRQQHSMVAGGSGVGASAGGSSGVLRF
ncbi:hypothetical protein J3Q64DRAFT_1736051 [Phycomyces blakesleeanus]|uniref:BZIP domain-containing protein n=1 Tax=Phycomyces blakesleeanus TaxID=4837 RepID=A0ABR3B0E5_PHYBL